MNKDNFYTASKLSRNNFVEKLLTEIKKINDVISNGSPNNSPNEDKIIVEKKDNNKK